MDVNTKSEHKGTLWLIGGCIAGAIAGQIFWPWHYFDNAIYDGLLGVLSVIDIFLLIRIYRKVWSNDLSPNTEFVLSFLVSAAICILPVIWHAGVMNHLLQ